MDWRIYHSIDVWASHHHALLHGIDVFEQALVVGIAAAAFALWLLARPGGSARWKLISASALAAGALGLALNQVIGKIWHRPRPYESHPSAWHPYATSHDPSFPSDHASAAFGIAWAVFLYDRAVGGVFLAVAAVLSLLRVVIGAHYPSDIGAGLLVGLAAALVVVKLGRPVIGFLVGLVERITDPILRPLWRRAA